MKQKQNREPSLGTLRGMVMAALALCVMSPIEAQLTMVTLKVVHHSTGASITGAQITLTHEGTAIGSVANRRNPAASTCVRGELRSDTEDRVDELSLSYGIALR
jgi:hypothetical protein